MNHPATPITDYDSAPFSANCSAGQTISHDVYRRGRGAPIIIIQELPGIGPETMRLADEFVEHGFEVILPHLFGPLEKVSISGNLMRVFCMRKEFSLFEANGSSPIVDWLKALCRDVKTRTQTRGVGVIGMCLTGNFAISLMSDESVLAAVSSQPSMPLLKPTKLHMSAAEIGTIRQRIDDTAPIHASDLPKILCALLKNITPLKTHLTTLTQHVLSPILCREKVIRCLRSIL